MKPKHFSSLNHFTVPVVIAGPSLIVLRVRGGALSDRPAGAGTAASGVGPTCTRVTLAGLGGLGDRREVEVHSPHDAGTRPVFEDLEDVRHLRDERQAEPQSGAVDAGNHAAAFV